MFHRFRLSAISLALCLGFSLVIIVGGSWRLSVSEAIAADLSQADLQALHQDLGNLYQQAFEATDTGQLEQAEDIWSQAIERMPENPATWSNRGNARISQFKLDAAIEDFDQAIAIAPDQPDAYMNRGIAWEGLKEWDRAIADYNHAFELDPDDAVTLNNRGNAKGGKGDWQAAQADFEQAANLQPGLAIARINATLAKFQLGDKSEAIHQMRNLVRKYPMAADTRAALTAMLWDAGSIGEAESNWVSAVGLDPRYKKLDWVADIRRWPPVMVAALQRFLELSR